MRVMAVRYACRKSGRYGCNFPSGFFHLEAGVLGPGGSLFMLVSVGEH